MAQENSMQPWEYVYNLLMPAKEEIGKNVEYIYLALAVPLTKEFEEKISKGYREDLELPVYPVAFSTKPARYNADRMATQKNLLTTLGLYDNDYEFATPIRDLKFNASIPGYFPLAVLKLYIEGGIIANPEDYGLKPIDGHEWHIAAGGGYKVTAGLLFNIAKAKNNGHYVVLNLDENPKEFNTLNGFGVARFDMSLKNAPPEVYEKAKEECESAGGIYRYDAHEELAYCTLPLNKEANIKASEFILQLNDMIKSKITSEDFLKHDMVYQLPGPKIIPVKPVIGKTFEDMVKAADKYLLLKETAKEEEEKETKQETKQENQPAVSQKSQEQLFNPFTIVDELLIEGQPAEVKQQQQNLPAEVPQQQSLPLKMNILTEEESSKSVEQSPENNIQTFGFKGDIADFFASLVRDKYIFLPILTRRSPSEYRNAKKQRTFNEEAVEEHTKIPRENMKYAEFRKRYNEIVNKYAVPFMHEGIWAILPGKERELYKELDRLVQEAQKLGISPEEIEFMVTVLLIPKDLVVREINRQIKEIRTDIDEVKQELQNPDLKKSQIASLKKQLEQKQLRLNLLKDLYSTVTKEEIDKLAGKVKDTLYTLGQIAKYAGQQEEANEATEEEEEEEENTVKLS